jgi:polysaccharide biosynthesis protein PslA
MLTKLHWVRFDGSLFLATFVGSVVTAAFLFRADAYVLRFLCQLDKQVQILALPLLVGCGSMIVSLSLMRDDRLIVRKWPFLWIALSAILLIVSRCYLTWMLRGLTTSGRLARRVAVIGAGEFSREFIERLRSEPQA